MYLKVTAKALSLQRAVDFHVILPYHDGYPDPGRPYPTLYLLPGYSGNAEEIVFGLPLRQMATLYGIAVVIPDGENAFYTDHPERASSMGAYAGDELVRITRRLFPALSGERKDTFIGGISMGGYGAFVLGMHYHETFSRMALFSPSAEPDRLLSPSMEEVPGAVPPSLFESLLGGNAVYVSSARLNPARALENCLREGRQVPPVWMCCGEDDLLVRDSCLHLKEALAGAGAGLRWEEGPGGHELTYWDEHLESAFRFLSSPEK